MAQAIHNHRVISQAGEYVLGTLPDSEHAKFEQNLSRDPELQTEVQRWNRLLSPMLDLIDPISPPKDIWQRIQNRLQTEDQRRGVWESLKFWRNLGMVAATLVLGLGLTLFGLRPEPGMQRVMMIASQDGAGIEWVVGTDKHQNDLYIKAVNPPLLPHGKVCNLWMATSDGSLKLVAVLPHTGSIQVELPGKLDDNSSFKVSVEPEQNLPANKPSGNIIYSGQLTKI